MRAKLTSSRNTVSELGIASPVHLRAGLSGAAYEAVRKLEHTKLKTKDDKGSPTDAGMRLFLETLRENIAAEAPVKINELFLKAFYAPSVWRKTTETMQQFIIRREQEFQRLEETLLGGGVPDHIRAMMLLLFAGLDHKEQLNVLSSCGNDYDFKKISHALRLQFPNSVGNVVVKKDLLGWQQGSRNINTLHNLSPQRQKWKVTTRGKSYAMAVDGDDNYEDQPDEDAFIEDTAQPEEEDAFYEDNTPYSYSDDETLDTYLQDFPEEDMELAEALATAVQNKHKKKTPSSTSSSTTNSFPFKAQGEMSFDAKARENRKNAVKFLKSVTPCTSCGRNGHWGDDECPNTRKKGKGKGKKGSSPKKKPSSTFFVLHDTLESEDEKPQTGDTMTGYVHVSNASPQYVYTQEPNALAGNVMNPEYDKIPAYVTTKEPMDVAENAITKFHSNATPEYVLATTELYGGDVRKEGSFTDCLATSAHHEVLMVLKEVPMCEHCSYNGGNENKYFRGANGHCRYLTCKERECDKTVLSCRRKEPAELWRYLVVVALCTKFGTAARSRELFSNVCRVRGEALEEREKKAAMRPTKPPTAPGSPPWPLVEPSPSSPASSPSTSTTGYPRARILRRKEPIIWLYGISLSASQKIYHHSLTWERRTMTSSSHYLRIIPSSARTRPMLE